MFVVLSRDAPQAGAAWWLLHRVGNYGPGGRLVGGPSGSNFDRLIQAAPTYWCLARDGEILSRHRVHAVADKKAQKIGGYVQAIHELSAGADTYIDELIANSIMSSPNYLTAMGRPVNSHAIQNGVDREPEARRWLSMELGEQVEEVSCMWSDDLRMMASPDGMLGLRLLSEQPAGWFDLGEGDGERIPYYAAKADAAVEIKVPEPRTHIGWLREGVVPLKHRQQCHSYFAIGGVSRVVFLSYGDPKPLMLDLEPGPYTVQLLEAAQGFVKRLDETWANLRGVTT